MRREALYFAAGYSHPGKADLIAFTVRPTGALVLRDAAALGCNPSTLCRGAEGRLYVGCENPGSAEILSWEVAVKRDGTIRRRRARRWMLPYAGLCHLAAWNGLLFGSCYLDGAFFAVRADSGEEVWHYRSEAAAPHAHWMTVSPHGHWLFACDLGADCVFQFSLRGGVPAPTPTAVFSLARGAGPRQALCRAGRLFILGQDDSTLTVFSREGESPTCLQRLPATGRGEGTRNYPATAFFTARGELLVANRGADTMACFAPGPDGNWRRAREDALAGRWPRAICPGPKEGLVLAALRHTGAVHCYRRLARGLQLCGALALPEASGLLRFF